LIFGEFYVKEKPADGRQGIYVVVDSPWGGRVFFCWKQLRDAHQQI
jgi:hypothetical protein